MQSLTLPSARIVRDYAWLVWRCGAWITVLFFIAAFVAAIAACFIPFHGGMHPMGYHRPDPFEVQIAVQRAAARVLIFSIIFATLGGILCVICNFSLWLFTGGRGRGRV